MSIDAGAIVCLGFLLSFVGFIVWLQVQSRRQPLDKERSDLTTEVGSRSPSDERRN